MYLAIRSQCGDAESTQMEVSCLPSVSARQEIGSSFRYIQSIALGLPHSAEMDDPL